MNLMRFREKLKKLPGQGILKQATVDHIGECPVFLCGDIAPMTDMEVEWCEQHVLDETKRVPKHLPFPVFSALYSIPDHEKEGISDQALIVWGTPYTFDEGYDYDNKQAVNQMSVKFGLWLMIKVDGNECFTTAGFTGREQKGMTLNTFINGVETTKDVMSDKRRSAAAAEIGYGARNVMLRVVFDIMNPANVVLRVTPNQPGRSAQWVKARTHYTIINKSQAQRCLHEKRGPSDHEIERAAHWRRAHMRRLMSDKFTHKKGQLVFVKQSWVGPEEWKGTDRKIYKVIHTQPTNTTP